MTSLRSTFVILAVAAAGMAALLAFLPAAGHDQLWCLYVAQHVLDGTRLYGSELLETNPPLIIWLSMVPAKLAQVGHIPAPALGKALVVVLEAVVAVVALRQLRRFLTLNSTQLAALAFAFIAIFNVIPARDLGQRDFLLTLLCLPYVLAAAQKSGVPSFRAPGERVGSNDVRPVEHTLLGLAAGVGLALKPHQAILPIAIELYLILRSRSFRPLLRPEPFAILAVAVAYLAAIHKFTPEYITTVLPILRDTYWAVGSLTLPQLIWQAMELHILAAAAIFLWLKHLPQGLKPKEGGPFMCGLKPAPTVTGPSGEGLPSVGVLPLGGVFRQAAKRRKKTEPWTLNPVPLLLIAGAASTLAYYLQGTGWYYQQLPAISFFALALVFELLPLLERPVPAWVPKAALALAVLALGLTTHFMNYPFSEARSFAIDTPDPTFFENLAPGTAVATLTTTVDYTVMPAARYGLTIAQRYPHLWMLPAILRNEQPGQGQPPTHIIPPARLAELDRMQHQFMVEDFQRWKPQLVLVERCQKANIHCQLLEDRDDDLLAWFLRDPAFAEQWKNYSFEGSRGPFDAYVRSSH
jgi:hypothetical protein